MENSDKEKSIKNVISLMKLNHLKELTKVFDIHVRGKKKENFIETITLYIKSNISVIISNFITYEEYELIKKLCDENYTITFIENYKTNENVRTTLAYLGIIYSYCDYDEETLKEKF